MPDQSVPGHDALLDPAKIRAAIGQIDPLFTHSPQFVSEDLSHRLGIRVVVKIETANPIGSFKGRGCSLALLHILEGRADRGDRANPGRLVLASSGNFGQGVAFAARHLSRPPVVFVHEAANATKVGRMRLLGADVRIVSGDFDVARQAAAGYSAETGAYLIVDGKDPWIAVGAGTLAAEVTDGIDQGRLPAIRNAYVPVGNGALICGVGAWLRSTAPNCRVIGVQSEEAAAMALSWRAQRLIETPTSATFADGIATRIPVPEALAMMQGRVDAMMIVSENQLRAAQASLTAALGITVEGAAAAAWAGLLSDTARQDPALIIVTGSNVAT